MSRTTSGRELLAQVLFAHRRAAVLDDDGLAVKLPYVGQRLAQGLDPRLAALGARVAHVEYSAFNST